MVMMSCYGNVLGDCGAESHFMIRCSFLVVAAYINIVGHHLCECSKVHIVMPATRDSLHLDGFEVI